MFCRFRETPSFDCKQQQKQKQKVKQSFFRLFRQDTCVFHSMIHAVQQQSVMRVQRSVSVTQETPRGGGLDLFPKNNNNNTRVYHLPSLFQVWMMMSNKRIILIFVLLFYWTEKHKTETQGDKSKQKQISPNDESVIQVFAVWTLLLMTI